MTCICMISFSSVDQTVHLLLKKQKTTYNFSSSKIIQQVHKKKNFDYKKLSFSTYQYLVGYPFIQMTSFNRFDTESTNFFVICVDTVPNPK